MICPRCKIRLTATAGGAHRWDCNHCSGCLVDAIGTHHALPEKLDRWLWELAEGNDASLESRCPKCQRFMHPVTIYAGKQAIQLDACIPCKVIWFDLGELTELGIANAPSQQQDSHLLDGNRPAEVGVAFLAWLATVSVVRRIVK